LVTLSYGVLVIIWTFGWVSTWILLPLLSLPWALLLIRTAWKSDIDAGLNIMLAKTAGLSFVYSVLLSIGIVLT
jgi:1,4-dihydroxy-2-naphthoate octaprenyltransferase